MPAEMTGRVCVITGASRGIGKASAEALASLGASLTLVCRQQADGDKVASEIAGRHPVALDVVAADLSSQAEIRRAAAQIRERHPTVHVLINNAGVFTRRRELTADGLEQQF
ncbi:MAG TPA: SDR family NAD(P)-dependent oxidoreductase, partial [Gemmatimonadales bacterium]|nr:SDR family NAD(P)-dependent oxidoreductase [Gemmatimonadales bacterium]